MARPRTSGPTDRELSILQVLWRRGPSTVREVHGELNQHVRVGYTSVQKIMQIMFDKSLVRREEKGLGHLYRAAEPEEQVQTELTLGLIDRAFRGSALGLVARALAARPASAEELEEIEALLGELKEEGRGA